MTYRQPAGGAGGDGRYPCPLCDAPADLIHGCTACGAPPDPDAAEIVRLNSAVTALRAEVDAARAALGAVANRHDETLARREALAERVRRRVARQRAATGRPATWPPPGAVPPAAMAAWPPGTAVPGTAVPGTAVPGTAVPGTAVPGTAAGGNGPAPHAETSTRTVQHLLFILGGVLLGSAVVVFAAVAWATFGLAGRAAILAGITVLVLLIPPVARWRRLPGTAETFAAVGLLLVALDGYAAWYVDMAGVNAVRDPVTYAGLVGGVTALVAAGYGAVTHLAGPRFAALIVAQPVPALLLAPTGPPPGGWAVLFAGVAAADLAVVWWTRRPSAAPGPAKDRRTLIAQRVLAWVFAALALGVAGVAALAALAIADRGSSVLGAAGAAVVVAAVLVAAGLWTGVRPLAHVSAAIATLGVAGAATRVLAVVAGSWLTLGAALVVATAVVATGRLPARSRIGAQIGALVAAGFAGVALAGLMAIGAALTAGGGDPAWHAALDPPARPFGWQAPVALLVIGAAVLLPRPRREWRYGVLILALIAPAVPVALALPWWAPPLVDAAVFVPLAILAARHPRSRVGAPLYGLTSLLLALHATLAGLARPGLSAAVLGTLVTLAAVVALLALRAEPAAGAQAASGAVVGDGRSTGPAVPEPVGAAAIAVGALAVPGLAACVGEVVAAGARLGGTPVPLLAALFGVAVVVAVVAVLRPVGHGYPGVAAVAGAGAAGVVTVAALAGTVAGGRVELVAVVAVVCALVGAGLAGSAGVVARVWWMVGAVVPAVVAAWAAARVVVVLVVPYAWVGAVWSGAPVGVGLTPGGLRPGGSAVSAVALAVLAGLVLLSRVGFPFRGPLGTDLWWLLPPGAGAVVMAGVAWQVPWPAVVVVLLGAGVAAGLAAALRRVGSVTWVLAGVAVAGVGAGVAGSLATAAVTLVALGAVVVAAVVAAAGAVTVAGRAVAWPVAVAAAAGFAVAASRAAGLPLRVAAFGVLGVAVLALALGVLVPFVRRLPGRLAEVAAHAVALLAVLLTAGHARYAAAVLALWGLALGSSALLVRAWRVRVIAAISCELVGYWVLLASANVAMVEAFTLPAAMLALLAGWFAMRARPRLSSWAAYGPALIAGFAPSLATALVISDDPWRRLTLGVLGVAVVVLGSLRLLQAPVIVGAVVVVTVAVGETVRVWDLLQRWIPLAVAGLVLIGLAATYERRRRDLSRLRAAIGRMR